MVLMQLSAILTIVQSEHVPVVYTCTQFVLHLNILLILKLHDVIEFLYLIRKWGVILDQCK